MQKSAVYPLLPCDEKMVGMPSQRKHRIDGLQKLMTAWGDFSLFGQIKMGVILDGPISAPMRNLATL